MKDENLTGIVRFPDGSISYGHYLARAALARNGEVKKVFGRVIETVIDCGPGISALATVVVAAIIL